MLLILISPSCKGCCRRFHPIAAYRLTNSVGVPEILIGDTYTYLTNEAHYFNIQLFYRASIVFIRNVISLSIVKTK